MQRRAPSLPLRVLYTRPLMLGALLFGLGALLARDGRLPLGVLLACAALPLPIWCFLRLRGRRCAALLAACALFFRRGAHDGGHRHAPCAGRPVFRAHQRHRRGYALCRCGDWPSHLPPEGRKHCRGTLGCDIRLYLRGDITLLRNIAPGQRIEATGHLWAPDAATNPGQFDFAGYLWRNGVAAYATAQLADATISGTPSGLEAWLHALRTAMGGRIDGLFPQSADMVRALVLGDRGDMEEGAARKL